MSNLQNVALAQIAAARRHFADSLLHHRHESLSALFTADTLLLPAGRPLIQGRAAVVAFWSAAGSGSARCLRSEFDAVDSTFVDDLVIEVGLATVFAVEDCGDRVIDRGKYIVIWKQEEGSWKRHRDIYNSDAPGGKQA